jgi:hypothetical protein
MLSIVIPQYNKAKMTEDCISSVIDVTKSEYEIVLVDNGSTDVISEEYKNKVNYIRSDTNLNFAGGCNLGALNAKYDRLCFLNNDTIPFGDWEKAAELLNNEIGIVGSKLLYPTGLIQHAGMEYIDLRPGEPVSMEHKFRNLPASEPGSKLDAFCPVVTGACLFITKSDFNKVKGFDENFRNWFEDVDLCYKIRFDLNKKVLYHAASRLIHLESATGKEMNMTPMHVHSRIYFYKKWMSVFQKDMDLWRNEKIQS